MQFKPFFKSALVLFLLGLLFIACEPELDNSVNPFNLPPSVEGNWVLVNSTGVNNGVNHDFPQNMVRWQFKPAAGDLKVVNNNLGGGVFDGPGSGEYLYEVRKKDSEKYLYILGLEYGLISELKDSSMVIDQH